MFEYVIRSLSAFCFTVVRHNNIYCNQYLVHKHPDTHSNQYLDQYFMDAATVPFNTFNIPSQSIFKT